MAIMLALGAAAFYGSADFVGGLASRRQAVLVVALGAQISGLVVLLVVLPLLGPATVGLADVAYGAGAGVFGAAGIVVVYRSLAQGPMSVVAPTSALSASSVPIIIGLVLGERPGMAALVGIAVALGAVTLITRERHPGVVPSSGAALGALVPAAAGGAIFGLFFVCLHRTGDAAGLWPLVAARAVSIPLLAGLVLARGARLVRGPRVWTGLMASGVLDMAANVLYLLAARQGLLAVVAAITGLYPATTILLARARLGEQMAPVQLTGLGVAAAAAVLVAV